MFLGIVVSCKKNKKMDEQLYNLSQQTGFTYYQNSLDTLLPASASPHGSFRVKFNSVAQKSLDGDGKLPKGSSFEDDAVVVKEIFDKSGGNLTLLAVMKKFSKSKNAAEGWIWGEYDPDGKTVFSISKKGDGCISCHTGGRDLIRLFDLH